ncbi:MAG TPA: hypothetical protein VIV83_07540 [Gemmatimonadales bacterium]|jgi:hypothetical protein
MTRHPRPALDPNTVQAKEALRRRLEGVTAAHADAVTRGDAAAVERYERLIASMTQCLDTGTQFYSLHRHRRPTTDGEP